MSESSSARGRRARRSLLAFAVGAALVPQAWAASGPAGGRDPAGERAIARPADAATTGTAACPELLRHSFDRLQDEQPQSLCQYAGKVLLVVNTASRCGYTPQYEGLEALHARYSARGLVVMGFPSNDFRQERGSREQIAQLCFDTYGVRFPMFTKTVVTGPNANPLHAALTSATGEAPAWNFHKYLVDRQGRPVASFPSKVRPDDPRLVAEIERLLAR